MQWYGIPSVVLYVGLSALAMPVGAQSKLANQPVNAPIKTMDVSEIRPKMRGYGLTVFSGTKPERFEVEVIDVLHRFKADQDLILVRTFHPLLDHATSVAGMSGSPIYLEGRLAGAYSYGWAYGKDPIAGVTPIANMMRELHRPTRPDSFSETKTPPEHEKESASFDKFSMWTGKDRVTAWSVWNQTMRATAEPPTHAHEELRAAGTPLLLSGFSERTSGLLRQRLEPLGLHVLQAGSGAVETHGQKPSREPFVNGGSVAMQLIRGDINATAVGTVTLVEGQRFVALGHPMLNAGETGVPTAHARVLHIFASSNRSFKIAEATTPYGTLIHDRPTGIVVDTNRKAATIPVCVRVEGVPTGLKSTWQFEVANHRLLTPVLIFSGLSNALEATVNDQTDVVVETTARLKIQGQAVQSVSDTFIAMNGAMDAAGLARSRLFALLEAAYNNPFERARVLEVELGMRLRFVREFVEIVDVAVSSYEVDPGKTTPIWVRLRPYGKPEYVKALSVDIAQAWAGEEIEVVIESGDAVVVPYPRPASLADILGIIAQGYSATDLVTSLKTPMRGLRFRGAVVQPLPRSLLDTLVLSNATSGAEPFVATPHTALNVGQVVLGSAKVQLKVREVAKSP